MLETLVANADYTATSDLTIVSATRKRAKNSALEVWNLYVLKNVNAPSPANRLTLLGLIGSIYRIASQCVVGGVNRTYSFVDPRQLATSTIGSMSKGTLNGDVQQANMASTYTFDGTQVRFTNLVDGESLYLRIFVRNGNVELGSVSNVSGT